MGYSSTVLDTLGVLFSYCLMVWGVEGFSETLCGGLSKNGLHTIYLNVWPPVGRAVWKGFWWCGLVRGVVSLEVGFEVSNTHGILSLSSLTPFLCLAVDQGAIAQLWLQCRTCLPVTVLHILLPSRTMSLCLTFKLLKCSEKTPWPRQPVEEKAHWGLSSWSTSTRQKERVRERKTGNANDFWNTKACLPPVIYLQPEVTYYHKESHEILVCWNIFSIYFSNEVFMV